MNNPQLDIKYLPLTALKPAKRNPRTHSEKQIQQIAASIQTFGFKSPVLIDVDQTIVAGHGRVSAAKLLMMEEVPTILLEDLTPDQLRAYAIADNKLA